MATLEDVQCCGIKELDGIQGHPPLITLYEGIAAYFEMAPLRAHIFFSTSGGHTEGKQLCALIKKNKLGKVTKTQPAVNGNTGNFVTMWVWTPNKEAVRAYDAAHHKEMAEAIEKYDSGWGDDDE